jgi:hypothetical protein
MPDIKIVKIKLRRGSEIQRKLVTFDQGELGYVTDTKRVFVGDGTTTGGTVVVLQHMQVMLLQRTT